jgi:hypothetical protein
MSNASLTIFSFCFFHSLSLSNDTSSRQKKNLIMNKFVCLSCASGHLISALGLLAILFPTRSFDSTQFNSTQLRPVSIYLHHSSHPTSLHKILPVARNRKLSNGKLDVYIRCDVKGSWKKCREHFSCFFIILYWIYIYTCEFIYIRSLTHSAIMDETFE